MRLHLEDWSATLQQFHHYNDIIMSAMASQITGVSDCLPNLCSGTDQRKYQSSASLAFVRGIHQWPVNFPHKGPVTWKMFSFHDVIMILTKLHSAIPIACNTLKFLLMPIFNYLIFNCLIACNTWSRAIKTGVFCSDSHYSNITWAS